MRHDTGIAYDVMPGRESKFQQWLTANIEALSRFSIFDMGRDAILPKLADSRVA